MKTRLFVLLPLTLAGLAGCLEPSPGNADVFVWDTRPGDTWVHDVDDSDTVVLTCTPANCDDGDPCSADWCDETTGQCQHNYPPVADAGAQMPIATCSSAAECDDGDPCTADTCEIVDVLCVEPASPRFCLNRPVPGCGFGCDYPGACDDGKLCTVDSCLGGTCYNQTLDGCSDECTAEGVTTASEAGMGHLPGQTISALGQAWMWQNDMFCTDDGLCNCEGSVALRDTNGSMLMRAPANANPGDRWRCDNRDGRAPELSCSPMHAGVSYVAWGLAGSSWDSGPRFAAAPMPQADAMTVTGWCLEPTVAGLSGAYDGQLSAVWGTQPLAFQAKIHTEADGTASLSISGARCLDNSCDTATAQATLPDQTVPLTIWAAGGRADIQLNAFGSGTVVWRYFGQRNNLTGRWISDFAAYGYHWEDPAGQPNPAPAPQPSGEGASADVAPAPEGMMTLTRTAPTAAASACE